MSGVSRTLVRVRHVGRLAREKGVWGALVAIWRRLRDGPRGHGVDVFRHFGFISQEPLLPCGDKAEARSLLWFIPDFNRGSGGHLNIFRLIWHLEQSGYVCHIVIVRPVHHHDVDQARREIQEHFFPLRAQVQLGFSQLPSCEYAVATSWETAYAVRAYAGSAHKVYFVQDYEPDFFPVGSESVLADNTYRFGFFGITAGGWLADKLAREYGMRTHAVGFGVEQDRYQRLPKREPEVRHVFFYARPPTPRRAFELGLLVLNEVWQRRPQTRFILAGWDTASYRIPFPHLACGTVALEELPDLYSQCDVALVLSLTNLSLLPLELMACGCTVVSNRGENVEWLLNDEVAELTDASPQALADAVCGLLDDDGRRQALSVRGEAMARRQTWEAVARDFEAGLRAAKEAR